MLSSCVRTGEEELLKTVFWEGQLYVFQALRCFQLAEAQTGVELKAQVEKGPPAGQELFLRSDDPS